MVPCGVCIYLEAWDGACNKDWWTNLLYINNFYPGEGGKLYYIITGWYIYILSSGYVVICASSSPFAAVLLLSLLVCSDVCILTLICFLVCCTHAWFIYFYYFPVVWFF